MVYDVSARLDNLGSRMKELHDNSLTYSRSSTDCTVDNFTPEKTDSDILMALGIAVVNEVWQDFVFDLADLATLSPAYPKSGDSIVWGTRTFRVMAIGNEVFKFTTSSRKRIRVHAKQIDG